MKMQNLFDDVENITERYDLLEGTKLVPVAFSGGKDSLVLSLILREIGYTPILLAVDMGYNSAWKERISSIANQHQFELHVINIRDEALKVGLERERKQQIVKNLEALSFVDQSKGNIFTPCTSCYNSKIFGLKCLLDMLGMSRIAFGHHGTDAVASLLKGIFMHLDHFHDGNQVFNRSNFESIVRRFRDTAKDTHFSEWQNSDLGSVISSLIASNTITTDEPPATKLLEHELEIVIVRPLYYVLENQILMFKDRQGLLTETSGCGHTAAAARQTPREIVQLRALKSLEKSCPGQEIVKNLLQLMESSFDRCGSVVNPWRSNRRQHLGQAYKPTPTGIDKLY